MHHTAVLLALGLVLQASAFAKKRTNVEESWEPAKATDFANPFIEQQAVRGSTPRPTNAPRALLGGMLEPRLDGYSLGPGTCGYVSSNGNSFTCIDTAAVCTETAAYRGCCVPNQDCELIKTTCVDYDAVQDGKCNLPDDFHTLCCTASSLGSCYTWLFSSSVGDDGELSTFSFLDCSARPGTGTLLDYDPAWSKTHVFDATTSSESTTITSTTVAPTTSKDTDDDDDDDKKGAGGGSKTNLGAIVGGAVGGVAALALLGIAIFLLIRRRKKLTATPDSQSAQMTGPNQPYSPPPASSASPGTHYPSGVPSTNQTYPQGHDPHMSMYSQQGYPPQGPQPYSPGQQYPNQYPPQQGLHPQHGYPAGYQAPSTASPPPHTTPSPGATSPGATSPGVEHAAYATPPHHVQELANNPIVGGETNRAELA